MLLPPQDAKLKIEAIQWMLNNAPKGHDLRSSRQLLKVRTGETCADVSLQFG